MSLGDRLKQLRQEKGLTQSQLGAYFNLAESSISLYESGKRSPDYATLKRLAAFFDVTADYLLDYSDSARQTREGPSPYPSTGLLRQLPVITHIDQEGSRLKYRQKDTAEWYYDDPPGQARLYWFLVSSDTLRGDGILPGDLALIEEPAQVDNGQAGLVCLPEGGCLLCRIFRQDSSMVLQCSNPQYPPRIYSGKEVSKLIIIGRVREIRRKY